MAETTTLMSGGERLAVDVTEGAPPTVLWLPGYRSDMAGAKAVAMAEWGARHDVRVVRFDYRGHGASGGTFADHVVSDWFADARVVDEALCAGPTIAVGSSMGGWIALLLARARLAAGRPLSGLVLIAPAPDFTERLMWPRLAAPVRAALERDGHAELPSAYGPPTPITMRLFDDGRQNAVMDGPLETGCPIHILQGMHDEDVPHAHALALLDRLSHDDVVTTLIKDGDHRLSRPQDIQRILAAVAGMMDDHDEAGA